MPINPTASVQVSVNGGSFVSGFVTAPAGATLQFRQNPALSGGANVFTWQLTDYAPALAAPTGWTNINGVYTYISGGTNPPVVTLPAAGPNAWGPYPVRLQLDGNPLQYTAAGIPNPAFNPFLTDESTVVYMPSPNLGLIGLQLNASTQYDSFRSWIGQYMHDLRLLDAALAGVTGTVPWTNLTHANTGQVLLNTQTKVTLNTTGGACLAVFPASPPDGLTILFKDPPNTAGPPPSGQHWATLAGQVAGNTGQYVEDPDAPGTFHAPGVAVSCPNFNGAEQAFSWNALVSAWLLV